MNGASIGVQSEGCALPVTPRATTFSIWGYVYSHVSALLTPGALPAEEMHHLAATFDESRAWLASFAGGFAAIGTETTDRSNRAALAAIEAMQCHMDKAARHALRDLAARVRVLRAHAACHVAARGRPAEHTDRGPRTATRAATPRLADAEVEARFAAGLRGARGRAARGGRGRRRPPRVATRRWRGRGAACARRARAPTCPRPDAATLAALAGLRDQGDAGFAGALVCTPAAPPAWRGAASWPAIAAASGAAVRARAATASGLGSPRVSREAQERGGVGGGRGGSARAVPPSQAPRGSVVLFFVYTFSLPLPTRVQCRRSACLLPRRARALRRVDRPAGLPRGARAAPRACSRGPRRARPSALRCDRTAGRTSPLWKTTLPRETMMSRARVSIKMLIMVNSAADSTAAR